MTQNDVMDYAKYFNGKNEQPHFYNEHLEIEHKLFVPTDDFNLGQKLSKNSKEEIILHYFEYDTKQNKLIRNNLADLNLHQKVFATTSPDFSVDSNNCFSCFNETNILKSRICAYRWQSECGIPVVLTLVWGKDKTTYKWAFKNVEKGSIVAVSSQGVEDLEAFTNGLQTAIEIIQPERICWYGKIYNFVSEYYDKSKIIKIQTRTQLLSMLSEKETEKKQLELIKK